MGLEWPDARIYAAIVLHSLTHTVYLQHLFKGESERERKKEEEEAAQIVAASIGVAQSRAV